MPRTNNCMFVCMFVCARAGMPPGIQVVTGVPCNGPGPQLVEAVARLPESATNASFAIRAVYR